MTRAFWNPMTNMGAFRDRGITIVRGEASTVWDDAGKALIDISGALWYCNVGYGRAELADAAAAQMRELASYKTYDGFTSPQTEALAERVAELVPLDGAKVFFQSKVALLPSDANQANDVYEWRAPGTTGPGGDTCQRPQGCLALISSGQAETASALFGMDASGENVFFQASDKLVPADTIDSYSLYDAREGGGIPERPEAAPCEDDACQGQGAPPPVLPNPASGGQGGGNVEEPVARRPCGKGKHRVKGRCVAVKHRKSHKHRKRAHRHRAKHKRRAGR